MNKELREMMQEIQDKKVEAMNLLKENKIEDARAMKVEIQEMQDKFDMMNELQINEMGEVNNMTEINKVENKVDATVAFNKAVLGKPLSEVQAALVEKVGEDGGYLVPVEQSTQIKEMKRQLVSLKELCNVIPVGSLSGSMPLAVEANDKLIAFGEFEEINQSSMKFSQVKFELGDHGIICPISNTLLQDEKANLVSFVGRNFAKRAVRTENEKILALFAGATKSTANTEAVIIEALNKKLDPAISAMAKIITNQDGFDYLDKLEDGNGRPILTTSLADATKKLFKGREIVVLSNLEMKSVEGGNTFTFYVGDVAEYVAFFDRNAYEMAVSTEAGFTKNATYMKLIERFDVKKVDADALVISEIVVA